MHWYLTVFGVLLNLERVTHVMWGRTELQEQAKGSKPIMVVAMLPAGGGGPEKQMHLPLAEFDTEEEAKAFILEFQDEMRGSTTH